jgi:hypothetical protein
VDDSTDGDRYVAMIAALREGSIRPGATG